MNDLDQLITNLTRLFSKPMNPALLALIVSLIEEAVKVAPGVAEDLRLIFENPSPVPADWEALRAKVLAKSYADYVPASALPPENVVKLSAPVVTPPATETPVVAKPGAILAAETSAAEPKAPETTSAAPTPYLPEGSPNPAYVHPV